MDAVFYAIGDAFEELFKIMPHLGNIPNALIVISIIGLFLIWTRRMMKYHAAGENE